ncbi:MAG: hypothetical protein JKX83_05675 [Pseudomonadales bacterium]|nr:hypothetical protein [Pseudomonadales bacterium]
MSVIAVSEDSRDQLGELWQNPYYDRRKSMGAINRRHLGVGGRRESESVASTAANAYVDIYDKPLAYSAFVLVLLSTLDAMFTQILLNAGAQELNSFVGYMLSSAGAVFIPVKVAVTGLAAVFLVIHHNFVIYRVVRVRYVLRTLVIGYAAVVIYEVWLLLFLVG